MKQEKRIIDFVQIQKYPYAVFIKKEFPKCDQMTEEQYLLKNVVQSFANKLYVEVKFLNKERISADK